MRKIIIGLLILVACVFSFYMYSNGFSSISSMEKLSMQKDEYDDKSKQLEAARQQYKDNEQELTLTLASYTQNKQDYEGMASLMSIEEREKSVLGDYYDLEYLWTIIGTHAIREGVNLGLVCTTSSQISGSTDYIYANLNFTVDGEYRPISEFIERCENDENLEFPISSFKMVAYTPKSDDDLLLVANYLTATFTVKDVPLSAKTLQLINNSIEDSAELQMNLNGTDSVTDTTEGEENTENAESTENTQTNTTEITNETNEAESN